MNKSINRSAKTALRTLLVLALVLSLFCMSALAADAPDYAHLEVGTANATSLKAGDTVKIPVSLAGLKEDQYLSGMSCNVAAMDSYLTVTGVEFAPSISGWTGGYNAQNGSVNMVNLALPSIQKTACTATVCCSMSSATLNRTSPQARPPASRSVMSA